MDTGTYPWRLLLSQWLPCPQPCGVGRDSHGQLLAWLGLYSLANSELSSITRIFKRATSSGPSGLGGRRVPFASVSLQSRAGNFRLAGARKLPRFIHPTAAGSRSPSADAALTGGGAASAGCIPSGEGTDLRQMFWIRSVENIQFLPFLTTDVNNLSWLSYGCLKQDWTLITVNTIGAALQTLYILVYFYFSHEKRRVLLQSMALLGVLILGYCYFNLLIPDVDVRLAHLGLFCSVFTISMYLSPLADLAKIIRTKSTRCLSFPLTVATFLASASWTLYGLQLNDLYIMVPNVPGIVTSILRFWLFWQFPPDQDKFYKPLQA